MNEKMPEDEQLYTLKEAQDYLRASRSTVLRLIGNGDLVAHKVGTMLRFYKRDLRAAIHRVEVRNSVQSIDIEGN